MVDARECVVGDCAEDVFGHDAVAEGLGDVVGLGGGGRVGAEVDGDEEGLRFRARPAVGAEDGLGR